MSERDLDYISKVSGIDFLALREKYQRYPQSQDQSALSSFSSHDHDQRGKGASVHELLSKYNVCQACNGLGIIKTIYNHMSLEKTCDECDGDSIILRENVNKTITSLQQIEER